MHDNRVHKIVSTELWKVDLKKVSAVLFMGRQAESHDGACAKSKAMWDETSRAGARRRGLLNRSRVEVRRPEDQAQSGRRSVSVGAKSD